MRKIGFAAFIAAFCLALFVTSVNAEEQMAGGMGRAFGANEIIGVYVENPGGDVLGRITDLVVDSEGRIALAVLSHGGFLRIHEKKTAIPFRALKYDPIAKHLILDISKEKLAAVPTFKMSDLSAQGGPEDFYKYFGQQPYWSEGEELFKGINEPLEEVPAESAPLPYASP
jgi:hypothetical protein